MTILNSILGRDRFFRSALLCLIFSIASSWHCAAEPFEEGGLPGRERLLLRISFSEDSPEALRSQLVVALAEVLERNNSFLVGLPDGIEGSRCEEVRLTGLWDWLLEINVRVSEEEGSSVEISMKGIHECDALFERRYVSSGQVEPARLASVLARVVAKWFPPSVRLVLDGSPPFVVPLGLRDGLKSDFRQSFELIDDSGHKVGLLERCSASAAVATCHGSEPHRVEEAVYQVRAVPTGGARRHKVHLIEASGDSPGYAPGFMRLSIRPERDPDDWWQGITSYCLEKAFKEVERELKSARDIDFDQILSVLLLKSEDFCSPSRHFLVRHALAQFVYDYRDGTTELTAGADSSEAGSSRRSAESSPAATRDSLQRLQSLIGQEVGSLRISSNPERARIEVNGDMKGYTNRTFVLKAGADYRVRVVDRDSGLDCSWLIALESDEFAEKVCRSEGQPPQ